MRSLATIAFVLMSSAASAQWDYEQRWMPPGYNVAPDWPPRPYSEPDYFPRPGPDRFQYSDRERRYHHVYPPQKGYRGEYEYGDDRWSRNAPEPYTVRPNDRWNDYRSRDMFPQQPRHRDPFRGVPYPYEGEGPL